LNRFDINLNLQNGIYTLEISTENSILTAKVIRGN
jgi:hypothetical protein